MKNLIALFILLISTSSFAADSFKFRCAPTAGNTNGLGIKLLVLDVSTEDPDAVMSITYQGGSKAIKANMSYEGTNTKYHFTPYSTTDGKVSLWVTSQNGSWTASVGHSQIDTFSILSCNKR